MAFSLHNHCPCRVLCRVHTRLTTAPRIDASCTSTATCKSLCAWNFLSCLIFCWSASSFDKQVDSVKEHLTRTQTDSLFVCGLLTSKMLVWFGLYKSCHRSTATSLAKTQVPIAGSPEKALNFFFFWISHCQLCELWRPGGNIQRCLREQVSQRWNPELRSRSYNRDTGAVLVQRAVRILHVEREVQRRKNKLGTGALRTFAWINCAEPVYPRKWAPAKTCTWPYYASVFWYGGKILQSNAAAKMCTNRVFGHPTHCILHTQYILHTVFKTCCWLLTADLTDSEGLAHFQIWICLGTKPVSCLLVFFILFSLRIFAFPKKMHMISPPVWYRSSCVHDAARLVPLSKLLPRVKYRCFIRVFNIRHSIVPSIPCLTTKWKNKTKTSNTSWQKEKKK